MRRYHHPTAFQPKANVPMVTETRDRLALQLRMASESLAQHPSIDAYNTLSKMLASLDRAGLQPALLEPGTALMNCICDRYEQTGAITVECEEAAGLRQVAANIDAALHLLPLQRFGHAVAEVEAYFAVVNIESTERK